MMGKFSPKQITIRIRHEMNNVPKSDLFIVNF